VALVASSALQKDTSLLARRVRARFQSMVMSPVITIGLGSGYVKIIYPNPKRVFSSKPGFFWNGPLQLCRGGDLFPQERELNSQKKNKAKQILSGGGWSGQEVRGGVQGSRVSQMCGVWPM
jgi:hypothetical protein